MVNCPVLIVKFFAFPGPSVRANKPLVVPKGLVPITFTDSEAFTVKFPPPVPAVLKLLAATCAPSLMSKRFVVIVKFPASPVIGPGLMSDLRET